jgi:YVTN family beta-propeller protein
VTAVGTRAYVTSLSGRVSVINTATNRVTATIGVGLDPAAVAVSPDGTRAYVANGTNSVSVINTATNRITATIHDLCDPIGVAVSPGGTHIYVANTMPRGTRIGDHPRLTISLRAPDGQGRCAISGFGPGVGSGSRSGPELRIPAIAAAITRSRATNRNV